ncbi:MAG TPA: hypothetical protein VLA21_02880 [Candidatus Limnocylindria bacterium]|nr:hypothetical protein [Candidatus Limnocylindria bacterium]
METVQTLLTRLLPILAVLGLGVAIRKTRLLDAAGVRALKTVVTRITLPFVIFRAFYAVDYTRDTLVTALTVFALCVALFALGFALRKRLRLTPLLPFTLAGFEMGMLGFPLFLLLAGQERMGSIAVADLGQEVFVFTVYLFLLRRQTGAEKPLGEALREIAVNPVIIAVVLGLVVGISGLGRAMAGTLAGDAVDAVCGFVGAPTAVLILLGIGYDLKITGGLLNRVGLALAVRLGAVALLGGAAALLLFQLIPYDPWLLLALLLMFSLPAPFILPVYSQSGEEADFVSAYLSLGTLALVGLFAVLLAVKPLIVP